MHTLLLLQARILRSSLSWQISSHARSKHYSKPIKATGETAPSSQPQRVSLFDELFPEEKETPQPTSYQSEHDELHVPRLPLSDMDHLDPYPASSGSLKGPSKKRAEAAAQGAPKQWDPAVLVLNRASKSLVDADFRRIAPKGRHIGEWTGPGDILKVIPGRNTTTFQQTNSYFLLFPNPAYARTYQNYITKLHRMSQDHTPTSLHSPLPPPPGIILEGEDIHHLLQDYALCPPSQRINILSMFAPFGATVRRLIEYQGYPQLTEPIDNTGRAVLFWVEGHYPTTNAVRAAIDQDGRDRGLQWGSQVRGRYVEKLESSGESSEDSEHWETFEPVAQRRSSKRWIVRLGDENETRRFVRAWHRRPFPLLDDEVRGEKPPIVNAEFLW
ncbi:MAG: hypothetical protein LQ339_004615 [Xanthoria mediterranea]|nr:MAG: hypothetical protein LQ339_004615 [Xanthoria mediterranea]